MPVDTEEYKGLEVISGLPLGDGGRLLNDNLKLIADRIGPCFYGYNPPSIDDDGVDTNGIGVLFEIGSRWYDQINDNEYVCLDNSSGSAVWKSTTTGNDDLSSKADASIQIIGGGLITGGGTLAANRTLTLSGATIFTDLLTRDGSGSGLDADKLDGVEAASFVLASNNLSDLTNATTARTNLSVYSIATVNSLLSGYQPIDATLTALAAQNWAANSLAIGSGSDTVSQVTFAANTFPARASTGNLVAKTITDFALTILDDSNASTARSTLGLGTISTLTAPTGTVVGTSDAQTLTNKSISLGSNTITGTKSQFDTACSDDNFAYVGQANSFTGNQSVTGEISSTKRSISGVSALTDGTTISVDASLGNTFTVTIAGNRTMSNPTNATSGQRITFIIKQDATGSRTMSWDTNYRFANSTAPTLTTTASKTDYIGFIYNSVDSKWDCIAERMNF